MPRIAKITKASSVRVAKQSKAAIKAALLAGTADTSTPVLVAAKPAKPDYAAIRADRQALIDAARVHVSKFYSGASLTVHKHNPPKLQACLDRIATPIQRAGSGASDRDHSLLLLLTAESDTSSAFDPSNPRIAADLGVLSRLSSLGYIGIAASTGGAFITEAGAERARMLLARSTA